MLRSRLDLLGIYNFDNTVLDLLEVPEDEDGNELITFAVFDASQYQTLNFQSHL